MIIRDMFVDNIDRDINGVVKVEQSAEKVVREEVEEYVITKELRVLFRNFFNAYSDSFDAPTANIGVWISGFFGSGKSHFLKILSYLLENKIVNGKHTSEYFSEKFADPGMDFVIDKCTSGITETILFNIDAKGSIHKDKTAVMRVFAKMFYEHLGFNGDNFKVIELEKYIESQGKTEEFRREFEALKGQDWISQRKAFAFNGRFIIPTLEKVLGMSHSDAEAWFSDKTPVEFSIDTLVSDIKDYVKKKPKNFRLLFLIDEAGQYIGTDTDLLLNLQTIVEKLGSDCEGSVWVVCTGQEAIDEVIKVRTNEFSRIQARFATRLSLTSSSVDEVIQKRVLTKTPEANERLSLIYNENDSVMRNLFSFTEAVADIRGFEGPDEFCSMFPFAPYQFILIQKVYEEIRKHGNTGKHLANGERSMLSGFQEAVQEIETKDEYSIVPVYMFYDSIDKFLEHTIRDVVARCVKAADEGRGVRPEDVNVLKLLYLIRYISDIKATLDNIVILMADDIRTDKVALRASVSESLDRLLKQNYISRHADTYLFLTDIEQDVQREIKSTVVAPAQIIEDIAKKVYDSIYSKKFNYGKTDFAFDRYIDSMSYGQISGGLRLRMITMDSDVSIRSDLNMMASTKGEAAVVLAENTYYELIESSLKIRTFIRRKNIPALDPDTQKIIRQQQDEATRMDKEAVEMLCKAIEGGTWYVDGDRMTMKGGNAASRIDDALSFLVSHVYNKLSAITKYAEKDSEIVKLLSEPKEVNLDGTEDNEEAMDLIMEYLDLQASKNLMVTMDMVQSRFQDKPYGWREIDIAATVARLMREQKVNVKYMGTIVATTNPKVVDMLRKRTETRNTQILKREAIPASRISAARQVLRQYFDVMDVPTDEDGIVRFILERFNNRDAEYGKIQRYYDRGRYPGKNVVDNAVSLVRGVLACKTDNFKLVNTIIDSEDDLLDSKDDIQQVDGFFKNQVQIYDSARNIISSYANELQYFNRERDAVDAYNTMKEILDASPFKYNRIPELNNLIGVVRGAHDRLLKAKQEEVCAIADACLDEVLKKAGTGCATIVTDARREFSDIKGQINSKSVIAMVDLMTNQVYRIKDRSIGRIEEELKPKPVAPVVDNGDKPQPKKFYKTVQRQLIFAAKRLETEADVDAYVEEIRRDLKERLRNSDGIEIK